MKVFDSTKTARKFVDLYETLPEAKQRLLGQKVRDLARMKVEGDSEEFYITTQDLAKIYILIARF
jgi:hypothetical protein